MVDVIIAALVASNIRKTGVHPDRALLTGEESVKL